MIVTLKKAHALSLALAQIKTPIPAKLSISVHAQTLPDTLAYARKLADTVAAIQARIRATYTIRDLVSRANEGTINHLVTQRASIDKQLEALNLLPNVDTMPTPAEIQSMLDAAKADTSYGRGNTIVIELPTTFAKPIISDLKRQRIRVEDELARLNFSTTVELPEDVVEVLRTHDLI